VRRKEGKYGRRIVSAIIVALMGLMAQAGIRSGQSLSQPNGNLLANGSVRSAQVNCVLRDSANQPVLNSSDALAKVLVTDRPCPSNVFELRSRLLASGAKIKTTLVGNRGFHNPKAGSFSLFEMVTGSLNPLGIQINDGEVFFGHFTRANGAALMPDQRPDPESLMIELIAWDPVKQLFNFYEVIGDGRKGQWFYRGDSLDIQADVKLLHRQPNPQKPQFGERLRCSGCHIAGGPIMKEVATPHNDWWATARHLPFGNRKPDAELARMLQGLVDAEELAKGVKAGLLKLAESEKFQKAKQDSSLQEQLRPLFCPVELNLESDPTPLDDKALQLVIPSGFLVDPMLARSSVSIKLDHYNAALVALNTVFPEIIPQRRDADHGWLTPVKAFSDTMAIESLIKQGLIDREFVTDVLAVDLTNPLFSTARCSLLRLLPINADSNWKETFRAALKAGANSNPAAQELLNNLTDPARDSEFHEAQAKQFLNQCQNNFQSNDAVIKLYRLLAQRRAEAFASEISRNPMGQILEPGFRVIFPQTTPQVRPGAFRLSKDCQLISQ
jgi:hypothetical protein